MPVLPDRQPLLLCTVSAEAAVTAWGLQGYISSARTDSFSLVADMLYVGDNAPRIARALFEIALKNQFTGAMECILQVRLRSPHLHCGRMRHALLAFRIAPAPCLRMETCLAMFAGTPFIRHPPE